MNREVFNKETPLILFWDDEALSDKEIIFTEIKLGFERYGWKIHVETDKKRAIRISTEEDIDALVLDLKEKAKDNNQELAGLDILKVVREKKPFLPIVMFTTYSESEYIQGAFKEDASYYLTAPIRSYFDVIRSIEVAVVREKSKERLIQDQYFASIGKLAAGVAHYIKNALWAISSRSQYLTNRHVISSDPEALNLLNTINKKCDDANKVVANLLNFARREPQENNFLEKIDLVEIVNEIFELVSFECEHYQIQQEKIFPSEPILIIGKEYELKEAFLNIAKNAIEAMPDGGKLTTQIEATINEVILKVSDSGIGMDEVVKHNMFFPFYTKKDNSTGFGLFDTRRIIHNHNGKIEVESQLKKGTTIKVVFDLHN